MQIIDLLEYGLVRVMAGVPECRVADVDFNCEKIIDLIKLSEQNNAQVLVLPELSLTSYSASDLFFQTTLLNKSIDALKRLIEVSREVETVIIVGLPVVHCGKLFNVATVISHGKCCGMVPKTYIPNNAEFYEARWFSQADDSENDVYRLDGEDVPFSSKLVFELNNQTKVKFGIELCEDLWAVNPPSNNLALAGANLIFNLSASNEYLGKYQYRKNLVAMQSGKLNAAYIYCSAGCGESTTDTVYSGHAIIAENGAVPAETDRFSENTDLIIYDIDVDKINSERIKNKTFGKSKHREVYKYLTIPARKKSETDKIMRHVNRSPFVPQEKSVRGETCREIFKIQSISLAKRLKNIRCKSLVLGISGGLDSTLALLVAVEAFKALNLDFKNLITVTMPGFGTTNRTKGNAEQLAEELGVTLRIIPIGEAVKQHFADIGHDPNDFSVVYENAQARERTQILMDISNQAGGIVLGTGDLSEIALGWSTYNADHISMYNVNCGVPKTLVKYMIEWCAEEYYSDKIAEILTDICNTPISPELLPPDENGNIVQETEKNVGPYLLNDFFLYNFVRFGYSPKKLFLLACNAFEAEISSTEIKHWLRMFFARFFRSQFKRTCVPDGPKVGTVALSPRADWRMATDSEVRIWLDEVEAINPR